MTHGRSDEEFATPLRLLIHSTQSRPSDAQVHPRSRGCCWTNREAAVRPSAKWRERCQNIAKPKGGFTMARARLNPLFASISGKIGEIVVAERQGKFFVRKLRTR